MSEQNLDRYVNEIAFRWDHRNISEGERMVKATEGAGGKRLVYNKDTVNKKASD